MIRDTTVFFDLETGGKEISRPIIQLAAIAVRGWEEIEVFERKILFSPNLCHPEALEINHYDPEVWNSQGIQESAVVAQFDKFLRDHSSIHRISKRGRPYTLARLAGHNIKNFDIPRVKIMFERSGFGFFPADAYFPLDTIHLAGWETFNRQKQPPNFKLEGLLEYYGIGVEGKAHDALTDVRASIQLARRMVESIHQI